MIMNDYDTLTQTYRETTVTPVIRNTPGEAPSPPPASHSEFIDGVNGEKQCRITSLLLDYSKKGKNN